MPVRFVSIHGTHNKLDIALFQDQNCLDSVTKLDTRASSSLLPFLDSLLKKHTLSLTDLSFIAVDKGPGAFTSLRVTITTVNGIAFNNKIPLIGISGLDALTKEVLTSTPNSQSFQNIVTLLNAYNNEAYFLVSKTDNKNILESTQGCQNIDILLDDIKSKFKDSKILFCGQGSQLYKTNIKHLFADQAIILDEPLLASAKIIGQMGYECWLKKENIENQITPLYLKTQYFAIRK
ncbi:MAG: tRNA (adenosine(37)-N6)-threonylcarbamoyltransferase complex dimerization subunit type 1 TsaB [Candidatus Babeliales bacterium]|jgi:tRNA threonylcarbamoyladenosine biosynthesis protein TsaB